MMKRVLITGKNSYIGTSVEKWLSKEPNKFQLSSIDLRNDLWRRYDFSKYDVVLHVAGIAHTRETRKNKFLYYEVNRDLAFEVARKAKFEGIKQFILLSTMSVYGIEKGIININSEMVPRNSYGKSKLEAEKLILELETESFKVVILRPPMVYGKGCKGNYPRLVKVAKTTPIFPCFNNKRSMIFIDNLSMFIREIIEKDFRGIFFPQNKEYVTTSEMVRMLALIYNRKIIMTKLFNPILKILNKGLIQKVFGDLVYERDMSTFEVNYEEVSFADSLIRSEI